MRCPGPFAPLGALSGGNAQKIIAAREFGTKPTFLIADQPTRGIDVAAANFIQDQIVCPRALRLRRAAAQRRSRRVAAALDAHRRALCAAASLPALPNGPDLTPARLGPYMLGPRERRMIRNTLRRRDTDPPA